MSKAILTPFTGGAAQQAGSRWRKKLLPVGEINYKGRVLKFTKDYLAGLVQAFNQRAYDQVPFQLAGDENKHTNDVERFGGEITGMTLEPDGLWFEMDPTERGSEVLANNPGLGVSARIVEEYDRADGKFFPRAIQHVLGTLDPRITGMGGWEAVAASNDVQVTYDLSGEQFAGKEPGMAELDDEQTKRLAALLALDPEKLAAVVAQMEPGTGPDAAGVAAINGGAGLPEDAAEDDLLARIGGMSDAELDALEAELEAGEAAAAGTQPAPSAAGLSGEAAMALELAVATGDENARQLGVITAQLDHERWLNERAKLVGSGGVPPYLADLAQPLLEGTGHTVELANGPVDAGQVMRRVLTETGKLLTQLGLQPGVELGSPMDEPEDTGAVAERDDVHRRAMHQMFGKTI